MNKLGHSMKIQALNATKKYQIVQMGIELLY